MGMFPSNQKKKVRCNDEFGPNHADPARHHLYSRPHRRKRNYPSPPQPEVTANAATGATVATSGARENSNNSSNSSLSPEQKQRRYSKLQMFSSQGLCAC